MNERAFSTGGLDSFLLTGPQEASEVASQAQKTTKSVVPEYYENDRFQKYLIE
jgi:hypothetical protein